MAITLERFFESDELNEKRFHPLAVENYRRFLDGIRKGVPLDKITDEDVKRFLSDWDYGQYEHGVEALQEWLRKCSLDNPESTLSVYPGSFPTWGTWGLKSLLAKVYDMKRQEQMILAAQKEKEARRKQAEADRDRFLKEVTGAAEQLKHQLSKQKKPTFPYSPVAKYSPEKWFNLQVPRESQLQQWVGSEVRARLPKCLEGLVSWDIDWEMSVLPYAQYENLSLACLTWVYRTFVVVTVRLRLLDGQVVRSFEGYEYEVDIPGGDVGTLYLGPEEWDHREGFSTPLALLALLAKGKCEADGIEVTGVDGSTTSFVVRGYYEDSIELDGRFREFIVEMGKDDLTQGLLKMELVDDTTAHLVKAHWGEALPPPTQKAEHWGPSGLELVVAKLVELGWSEDKALEAAESVSFPQGATVDDTVKYLIQNPYAKP